MGVGQQIKIMVVATHLEKGGAELQLRRLSRVFADQGEEVLHLCLAGEPPEGVAEEGVRVVSLDTKGFRSLSLLWDFARFVRVEQPDVIVSCVQVCDILAGLVSIFSRRVWLMREANSRRIRPYSRLRKLLCKHADVVVSNNRDGFEFWSSLRGRRVTDYVPNLMDIDAVRSASESPQSLDLGQYICCVGRLEREKGFDTAIRAMRIVNDTHPELKLLIAGAGTRREELEQLTEQLGLADQVVFLGKIKNPYPLMKHSLAVVSPSLFEGCPNVAMEALAVGAPLVLSDIEEHQVIFGRSIAKYFSHGDVKGCAEMILSTLSDTHTKCRDDHQAERDHLIQNWSMEKNGVRYLALIRDALSRRQG